MLCPYNFKEVAALRRIKDLLMHAHPLPINFITSCLLLILVFPQVEKEFSKSVIKTNA